MEGGGKEEGEGRRRRRERREATQKAFCRLCPHKSVLLRTNLERREKFDFSGSLLLRKKGGGRKRFSSSFFSLQLNKLEATEKKRKRRKKAAESSPVRGKRGGKVSVFRPFLSLSFFSLPPFLPNSVSRPAPPSFPWPFTTFFSLLLLLQVLGSTVQLRLL